MGEKLNNEGGRTFEESLEELESILSELENSKIPLDELVEKYTRAKARLADCRKKLEAAELKIGKLSGAEVEGFPAAAE
ncbi:MAG: exodeoxyribonuclease VII small subunit [Verrucomicrobia bacterium CAG:312_58_20]|nr:MAG: exodeoxyribonuclease VII small subunit [Verrucomicrobia bacterium CAG:312_58_20]PWL69396.1 MAG: exodeoxyribonuclease VII small subunit [Verrucomicrobiota bacterium]